MIFIIIIIAVIILIIFLVLLKSTNVPKKVYRNKVKYSDHRERPVKALYSSKYNLVGKPDFILHTKDGLLPLEIKSSQRPNKAYYSHVMQLISYCLLMEEQGKKPKYGFIQYKGGKPFSVTYTESKKRELLNIMNKMRKHLNSGQSPKPVRTGKCYSCSYERDCF